jgi:hypothetical protein
MSVWIPAALFVATCLLWGTTVIQNVILLRAFVAKYPDVAAKEIPEAFSHAGHPEKAVYFFRRKAKDFLRSDRELWKQRQRFVYLCVASLSLPFLGFGLMMIYAIVHAGTS